MRAILFYLIAVSSAAMLACDDGPVGGGGTGKPALVAGYEYINWAWGFQQEYVLIDERGTVWQSFPSEDDSLFSLDTLSSYSLADFDKLLANADSLAIRVSLHELRRIQQLAGSVGADSITDCIPTGNDMGSSETFLFVPNRPTANYRRVLLNQVGDFSCYNVHPATHQLDSIILQYHMRRNEDPGVDAH